jgi:aminopeptidase
MNGLNSVLAAAKANLAETVTLAMDHTAAHAAVIVWDERCALAKLLAEAYRTVLPKAVLLPFDLVQPEEVMRACTSLHAGDLVVLIQSSVFRITNFRTRVELYKRGLKVIEHPHLASMSEAEIPIYVASLAYDRAYYRGVGRALQQRLDSAKGATVESGAGHVLTYDSSFESAKVNIGDFEGMPNMGGQFPLGEVFTEASELTRVSGKARIFAFTDTTFKVNAPDLPVTIEVEAGRVISAKNSTPAFDEVLAWIRRDEGEVWVREFGLGLNRAFSPERRVTDVGSYERVCGIHLSLGAKHNVYNKKDVPGIPTKYHADIFVLTDTVHIDGECVFREGAWTVGLAEVA